MTSGVIGLSGNIIYQAPGLPNDPYLYGDPSNILVFAERDGVELSENLGVDIVEPRRYARFNGEQSGELAAGSVVDSYLVQFYAETEQKSGRKAHRGTIQFGGEIVAVIARSATLQHSDVLFGFPADSENGANQVRRASATTSELRGLEKKDVIELSGDRRTLAVTLRPGKDRDQIRVLVKRQANSVGR